MHPARFLVSWLTLLALIGCLNDEDRLRSEAQRFVELYRQVDYRAPSEIRTRKLRALEQAVFVAPQVVAARDVCLAGQRTLLDAQQAQDETAAEIDRALSGAPGASPLPPESIERLQTKLQKSQGALGEARRQLEDCEAKTRALDLRFGKH